MKNSVASLLAILALCLSTLAYSDDNEWSSLTTAQQQVLRSTEAVWPSLSADVRKKYIKGAQRWLESSPEQRQQAQERYRRWKSMSADQKMHMRGQLQRIKQRAGQTEARAFNNGVVTRQNHKANNSEANHNDSQGDEELRKRRHRRHRQH